MHVTIVANTSAGSSDADAVEEVRRTLAARHDVRVIEARGTEDLASLLSEVRDALVVAGGDGTVHAAVNALDQLGRLGDVAVGLVPLGTGNDFARTLGLPLDDPVAAARVAVEGVRRHLDVLRSATGELVVNAVHLGVGADASRAAAPWKERLGRLGYIVGAVVAGLRTPGRTIRVVADGNVVADGRRRVLQVAIGNGVYVGGGTPMAPSARPDDGRVDVVLSLAVRPVARLAYAVRLRRGSHPDRADVLTTRAREVVASGKRLEANADGELLAPASEHRWTVQPGALTFVAPETHGPQRHRVASGN